MNKKVILSTLLISSALLGTSAAHAATSAVQPESKLVTVDKDNTKLYSNSKLDKSTTVKSGTVYKVNGYRDINGKKYYRVYQQDTKGKNVYKGYLLDTDAKDLQGQAPAKADRFVGVTASKAPAWKNLYFNIKIKDYNGQKHSSNFEVKTMYKLGDKTYYSLYRDQKWMGYMDSKDTEVLTPENVAEGKQAYKVDKAYDTYSDIYFTKNGVATVGDKVTVKRIYTFGSGRKYASIYNSETGKWIGYINLNALSEDKEADAATQEAINAANDAIAKAEGILSKAQASPASKEAAQKVIDAAKETVKSGTLEQIKEIPAQIKKAMEELQPGATTIDVQRLENAIKAGEETVQRVTSEGVGTQEYGQVEAVKKAVEEGKKVLAEAKKGTASSTDVDKAVANIDKAITDLAVPANSIYIGYLQQTIKAAEDLYNGVKNDTNVNNKEQLQQAIDKAKTVLTDAKAGKVNAKEVGDEIKALEKAMKALTVNASVNLETEANAIVGQATRVYLTKEGKAKLKDAMDKIHNMKNPTIDEYLKAKEVLAKAKAGLANQPDQATGKGVVKVLGEVEELAKLPNKGEGLTNIDKVKTAYDTLNKDLKEMKKDPINGTDTATVELTKKQVEDDITAVKSALDEVTINETAYNTFLTAAEKLSQNDSALTSTDATLANEIKAFQQEVGKNNKLANLSNIMAAGQKVYDTMVQDLEMVLKGVLPWNNNQVTNNPTIKPANPGNVSATLAAQSASEAPQAVKGQTLNPTDFAKYIIEKEPNVEDYYTAETYTPFAEAIVNAEHTIKAAKDTSKDKPTNMPEGNGSQLAVNMAKAGEEVNNEMKALQTTQAALTFDRQKMINLATSGQEAKNTWLNTQMDTIRKGMTSTPNYNDVKAQAQQANIGFFNLAKKLGYSLSTKEDIYGKNGAPTQEQVNTLLKPTAENAKTLAGLVYNAENGYYEYCQTVTVNPSNGTVTPKTTQK